MSEQAPSTRTTILTLRFQGAAPPPHPPCTDATPDQQFEIEVANKARAMQEKEAKAASAPPEESTMGKLGGYFNKAANAINKAADQGYEYSERKLRDWEHNHGQEKFTLNFPELAAAADKFITSYSGAVMHQGQLVQGTVFISERHLCFASDTLKEAFALQTIGSIQRSIALKTADQGPPFIMPIPAPHVLPNCIQFFMTDLRLIQFLEFDNLAAKAGQAASSCLKGKPVDRFYNWIDHQWRKMTPVPVPGVTYAQY